MAASDHIPDEILAAYARDPDSHRDIEEHLNSCDACRRMAGSDRALAIGMSDRETWRLEAEIASQRAQLEFRHFDDRLDAEDAEAERILEPVLQTPYSLAYANITAKPRFRTGGVVRKLMSEALDQCHKDPKYALALAATGQLISTQLSRDSYPAEMLHDLRGNVWKDFATVYRYLGKFDEAFRSLARAEEAFKELTDDGMGLAAVKHGRAQLLHLQQKNVEALLLAREAAEEYAERRATVLHLEVTETIAIILNDMHNNQEARAIYQTVFDSADTVDNPEMKARSAKGLGVIARDSGDFGTASRYFLQALQIYQSLGKDAMVVRMKWSIARLALMAGNPRAAAVRLAEIGSALAEKGMVHDAAEVELDRVEAHLALDEYEQANSICKSLPAIFIQANMVTGALTAASYLREVAEMRRLTRADVQHVRRYLTDLERRPDLEFAPPPPSL